MLRIQKKCNGKIRLTPNLLKLLPITVLVLVCCQPRGASTEVTTAVKLPHAPKETEAVLNQEFPGVMSGPEFSDSVLHYLRTKYGIAPHNMLLGASTCVDDIIYTKNFHMHPEIKGPFHLGGLAGLPFTGISGLEAFAHHVPDSGTMVLIVMPHIGYSQDAGWGYVLRHEQHEASSCCGALMGTLGKLQKGMLDGEVTDEDYQGDKIGELALQHRQEILESKNPIIALTKLTSASAEGQIRKHVLDVGLVHTKYIVIITGVLIDTDFQFCDYTYWHRLLVYDVGKKQFVDELQNSTIKP
jgi:Limiting CO2-inducible proteins B/C beta carbonyic anhydrases